MNVIRYFEHHSYEPLLGPDAPTALDRITASSFVCDFFLPHDAKQPLWTTLAEKQAVLVLGSITHVREALAERAE